MSNLLFDTATLQGVVAALPTPKIGLSGKYFPTVIESASREIHFDIEGTDLEMTPFCSPLVEAPIMGRKGFQTKTFRPAYLNEKTPFTVAGFQTRQLGEKIGGELTPHQRMQRALGLDIRDKMARLERRFDWMATRAMLDGKITVQGRGMEKVVVDFGRSPDKEVVLSGGQRWGQGGVKPLELLHEWAGKTDTPISDFYLSADAYAMLRADEAVQKRMDTNLRGTNTISNDAILGRDMTLMGMLDGFRIWVMPNVMVKDEEGKAEELFPKKTVLGVSDQSFVGARHFGAIEDVEAAENGLAQGMYHISTWVNKDPSVRFVMLQSSSLMVPYRPNATFKATVA